MKKIIALIAMLTLATLVSCTKEVTDTPVTEETTVVTEIMTEEAAEMDAEMDAESSEMDAEMTK
jgi:hypothetical protein